MESDSSLATMDRPHRKFGKFSIIKNLVVMSISMMLISTAYDGLSMLQSTLNQEIGTASQAMVYTIQCLSSLILPKYVVKKFGCKSIFVTAVILFMPYIAANFYPTWFTLVFTAIFLGVAMSMIFASQTLYFNESVLLYCRVDSTNVTRGVARERLSSRVHPKSTNCTDVNKGMVILKVEDLGKSEDSLKNNVTENSSQIKHLNLKSDDDFSTASPDFTISDDITKGTEIETSNINKYCMRNNISEKIDSLSFLNVKFKGETSSEITDMKSRPFKKNKLAVSAISNVNHESFDVFVSHDVYYKIKNHFPSSNIESEFKNLNVETFNENESSNHGTLNVQHEDNVQRNHGAVDVQHKGKNSRNHGMIDVQHERDKSRETKEFQQQNIEYVTARFFGANGLAFHSAQVWGNLISYFVLQKSNTFSGNPSCVCGASLCEILSTCFAEESYGGTEDVNARYLLTGISLAAALLSVLLVMFLMDPLCTDKEPSVKLSLNFLMATLRHCKKKTQLFLVPISLYVGMLQGFYTADFTKSYIACALGPSRVGLVTASYGLSCALSSPLSGFLVKYTGRIPVFLLMQSVNLSILVYLRMWSPNFEDPTMFYATAILLGVVTGTQWSQIPAFHGILFQKDEEAAFASYYLFNALGWSISFAYSDHLCMSVKLYILLAVSCLGIVGYLTAERTYYTSNRTNTT